MKRRKDDGNETLSNKKHKSHYFLGDQDLNQFFTELEEERLKLEQNLEQILEQKLEQIRKEQVNTQNDIKTTQTKLVKCIKDLNAISFTGQKNTELYKIKQELAQKQEKQKSVLDKRIKTLQKN